LPLDPRGLTATCCRLGVRGAYPPYPSAPHPRQPRQHSNTHFFTGWMPFLLPNQQRQIIQSLKSNCTIFTVSCLSHNCYVLYQDYHSCTTENASGDWFGDVREVDLKQEPYDVCCVIYQSYILIIKSKSICTYIAPKHLSVAYSKSFLSWNNYIQCIDNSVQSRWSLF